MFIEERHQEILKIIRENGRISINEIQDRFGVSVDSARRDLRILEERQMLMRTHGGAIPARQVGVGMPRKWHMSQMKTIDDNYDAIARKAVEYIKPNDAVYLTSGSVGYLMIKYLPTSFAFTIVTNSVDNASELRDFDNLSIYLIGGQMRQNGRIVDAFALEFVRNMRFDVSFFTGAGFSADFGVFNNTPETAAFQRQVAANTRQNIALFPSRKLGHQAFIKDIDTSSFDVLITDWEAVPEEITKTEKKGIQVVIAAKPAQ